MEKESCEKLCVIASSDVVGSNVLERFRRVKMLDLIFVALTIIFFLIALAYVRGCEKLQ